MTDVSIFPLHRNVFTICLAAFVFTGAFSRFTHGKYTPRFYAYQEYHQKDDGSTVATMTPVMDLVLATALFVPRTRFLAAITLNAFFAMGLGLQLKADKRWEIDSLTIGLALLAVIESARRR